MATIFPGNRMKKTRIVRETGEGSVTFDGLEGGIVEYVITGLSNYFAHWPNYLKLFTIIVEPHFITSLLLER